MKILLLGNGFDLHHDFPSTYLDFLHVSRFLIENFSTELQTVGDVFRNPQLQMHNARIKRAYEKYTDIYDSTLIDQEGIRKIIEIGMNNRWYKYFCYFVCRDIKWIDFESEIKNVLCAFEELFSNFSYGDSSANEFRFYLDNMTWGKCLLTFDFFHQKTIEDDERIIKQEYVVERPMGSGELALYKEKIINELFIELTQLAEMLKNYLLCFVDNPSLEMNRKHYLPYASLFMEAGTVYTFNYTNTFEQLYNANVTVHHLHGNTLSNIVLGINPNEDDKAKSIDVSFLQFKKYFQRVFHKTDLSFIESKRLMSQAAMPKDIYIIGHSLDVTDEDVIRGIFGFATTISVYYHDTKVVGDYIRNLVKIYGKKKFDELREEKQLRFISMDDLHWSDPS